MQSEAIFCPDFFPPEAPDQAAISSDVSSDDIDSVPRHSLPVPFVDYVEKEAACRCNTDLLVDDEAADLDRFQSNVLQLLALFGMFPYSQDTVDPSSLLAPSVLMEHKPLGILVEDGKSESERLQWSFFQESESTSRYFEQRRLSVIFLLNSRIDSLPRVVVLARDVCPLAYSPVIVLYSRLRGRVFSASDFRYYTRSVDRSLCKPDPGWRNHHSQWLVLVRYKLLGGRWFPFPKHRGITEVTALLRGTGVRQDGLKLDFSVAGEERPTIIGYIGRLADMRERVGAKVMTFTEMKAVFGDTPVILFRRTRSALGHYVMALYVPGLNSELRWKAYGVPSDPNYIECTAHADRFMREVCTKVIYLSGTRFDNTTARDRSEPKDFAVKRPDRADRVHFFGSALMTSVACTSRDPTGNATRMTFRSIA
jgi:hypothetical protein